VSSSSDAAAYAGLLEDIATGVSLHYSQGDSRDPDLDLLAGDERYADALMKLAALGDLDATQTLGDAISRIARAYADGDEGTAFSVWEQAVSAVRGDR
jgi:hypothetical protein